MNTLAQQLLNALALGSIYALVALGIVLVASILGLANFAHGELLTICAYAMLATYYAHLPWIAWVVVGLAASVIGALLMERVAFRPMRHSAPVTMLLASLGLSIFISYAFESFVSERPKALPQPQWMDMTFKTLGLTYRLSYVLVIGLTALALAGLLMLLTRTTIGTAMRGAAEDFDAVRLMGVKADFVLASAFAISGLLAGLAAVLILALRGSLTPHMGFTLIMTPFMAVVVGGWGNLYGAVVGAYILGALETLCRAYLPTTVSGYTTAILYLFIAVLLTFRPRGLFPSKMAVRA